MQKSTTAAREMGMIGKKLKLCCIYETISFILAARKKGQKNAFNIWELWV